MKNNIKSNRFQDFGSRPDSQSSQTSLGSSPNQSNSTWQSASDIWTMSTAGAGVSSIARDISRVDGGDKTDAMDISNSLSVLAAPSGADVWLSTPWNHLRISSPFIQSQPENPSPSHTRYALPYANTSQNILEAQNSYQQSSRHAFSHVSSFSRPSSKDLSNHEISSSSFMYAREASSIHDTKENVIRSYPSSDKTGLDSPGYLSTRNSSSRDESMLSGTTDTEPISGSNMLLGNNHHTRNGNFSLDNLAFAGLAPSIPGQANTSCFDLSSRTCDLSRVKRIREGSSSPRSRSGNPTNNSYVALPNCSALSTPIWNQNINSNNMKDPSSNQPIARSPYDRNNKISELTQGEIPPGTIIENHRTFNTTGCRPQNIPSEFERHQMRNLQISQSLNNLERKMHNLSVTYPQSYMLGAQFQFPISPRCYEAPRAKIKSWHPSLAPGYPSLAQSYQQPHLLSSNSAKERDIDVGFRSILLEQFRANTNPNKKYDLKDLYHHIVEFSGDQHGSRFIQTKLETSNSEEKEQVFREIQPNALQLMTDVYGNYVIQKLFEHGNQLQKRVLAEQMRNHVIELSLQMYGCRVVQKALEHVLDDQQAKLVEELKKDVLKCVKDQNGNHVIQKAIERVPSQKIQFLIDAFAGKVEALAVHPYGCRVIQRILEFSKPCDQANILKELHECAEMLISDQYGNYVTQHVIQHGSPEDRDKIINIVIRQVLKLSMHKYASNVVEKSIIYGTEQQRHLITTLLTTSNDDKTSPLQLMMKDQFGNYVIQKLLAQLQGAEKFEFLNIMKIQLLQLKKKNFGKQIDIIEKLLFKTITGCQNRTSQNSSISIPIRPTGTSSKTSSETYSNSLNDSDSYEILNSDGETSNKLVKTDEGIMIKGIPRPDLVVNSH